MKQRSPFPSVTLTEENGGSDSALGAGEGGGDMTTIRDAMSQFGSSGGDDTRTPTRTPINKPAPLRQYGYHGGELSRLAGGVLGSPVLEDAETENCDDDE
jgi:hypothetical protein